MHLLSPSCTVHVFEAPPGVECAGLIAGSGDCGQWSSATSLFATMEDTVPGVQLKSVSPTYGRRDQPGLRRDSDEALGFTSSEKMKGDQRGGIKLAPNARNRNVKKAAQLKLNMEKRKERQNALRN